MDCVQNRREILRLVAGRRLILLAIALAAVVDGELKDEIGHLALTDCSFISIVSADRGGDRGPTPFRTLLLLDHEGQDIPCRRTSGLGKADGKPETDRVRCLCRHGGDTGARSPTLNPPARLVLFPMSGPTVMYIVRQNDMLIPGRNCTGELLL